MRKIFKHKYFVRIFAFVALLFALLSIISPLIKDYNSAVEYKQIDLRKASNGTNDTKPDARDFSAGYPINNYQDYYAEIMLFLCLAFSLLITKRIIFSFLFAFLYITQYIILLKIFYVTVKFPASYFINFPSLGLLFIGFVIAIAYWQSSIICCFSHRKFQTKIFLK